MPNNVPGLGESYVAIPTISTNVSLPPVNEDLPILEQVLISL
jgi:hypothetical protein